MWELESPLNTPKSIPLNWRMPVDVENVIQQVKANSWTWSFWRVVHHVLHQAPFGSIVQSSSSSSVQSLPRPSSGPPASTHDTAPLHRLVMPTQIFETRLMKCSLLKTAWFFGYVKKSIIELDSAGSASLDELLC